MPETITILAGGHAVPAVPGDTILSAMRAAGRDIHSICGARGMCGTCRVAIDEADLGRLTPPAFAEIRLLKVLRGAAPNHRLACQTILTESHNGLRFRPDTPPTRQLEVQKS